MGGTKAKRRVVPFNQAVALLWDKREILSLILTLCLLLKEVRVLMVVLKVPPWCTAVSYQVLGRVRCRAQRQLWRGLVLFCLSVFDCKLSAVLSGSIRVPTHLFTVCVWVPWVASKLMWMTVCFIIHLFCCIYVCMCVKDHAAFWWPREDSQRFTL